MASGESLNLELPYPIESDPVNVHGDIKTLVDKLDIMLPSASYVEIPIVNKSGVSLTAGTPVYISGHNGTNVEVGIYLPTTTSPILGLIKTTTANNGIGIAVITGILSGVNTSSYSAGDILYVAENGGLTKTSTALTGTAIAIVAYSSSSLGTLILGSKGSPTWASIKTGL